MQEPAREQHLSPEAEKRPKVEIGWLLEGDLSVAERDAVQDAAAEMKRSLVGHMPQFEWVIETLDRPAAAERGRIEPVRLLDTAEIDRDRHGWDFAFVVTSRELRGREKSRVLGATAGLFATALMSTAFLEGAQGDGTGLASRLQALAMHLFGRLNGLVTDRSSTWMRQIEDAGDLDGMNAFQTAAVADLSQRMSEVADLRVEEMEGEGQSRLRFYARSLWQNRGAVPHAILRMRPWSFPFKLRRLTTAAGSTLAVLMMTAESWEVAANLSTTVLLILSVAALAVTSGYLIKVQHLVASRGGPLREQRAVSNAGTVFAVVAGMSVTYAVFFAVAWCLSIAMFGDPLLSAWTGASSAETAEVRVRLAALAASLSVVIGALGASFEPYGYFRHVTQIDDEI